ncbi:AI-2E family transporter [Chitinophaga vietnamensis]|uniref:AI-2E family transporter n=1 Tax=Chitinophaga vietnamensis TaxID=2593957 RepID=UPI00137550B6|nr:AI-2E family transporter [Chitinophaga vietnamensis]
MRQTQIPSSRSVVESILVLLLLLGLLYALYDVLKVFFGVFTFALIFFVSFSQPYEWLVRKLNKRRKLAAVLYAVVLVIIVALPLIYLVAALGRHLKDTLLLIDDIRVNGLPPLPDGITHMPMVGESVAAFWQQLRDNPKETIAGYEHHIRMVLRHLLSGGAGILGAAAQFVLGIFISAFMLVSGQKFFQPLKTTLQHLLGRRDGLTLMNATASAIKGVSIGVMGTAFIATVISWIGFTIAGVHYTLLLSALVFFCVLIQVGPLVVWLPLIIWMATQGHPGMTVFLAIYGAGLLVVDAILKPVLIAKSGGKLPFMVLFLGVIGGLAAWGFTGMFKGAIILAVFHTVFKSWLARKAIRTRRHNDPPAGQDMLVI